MGIERLDTFFHPASVAIVGASERKGSVGRAVMQNLIAGGFTGSIHPINPRRKTIMDRRAFSSLRSLNEAVDLVVITTPLNAVPEIIGECGRAKASGAIIISAGGRETGEIGRQLENRIYKTAAETGVRILGPNCLGIMCQAACLNATLAKRMPATGRLAFVSQSAAICTAILDHSIRENIGFSYFVGLGTMLDVNFADVIDYLGADPTVGSIVMYVESLSHHRRFMSAARAVSRVKPIIALKAGRSTAGAAAAASHTGAMAGEDAVYDAAFQRCGIVRVRTFEELFDTAEILSRRHRFKGPKLTIVTNGGGPGVMATDALADHGVEPAVLLPETIQALDDILPGHWSRGNPIDILGDATPERYAAVAAILSRAKEVQALLFMLAPQAITDAAAVAQTIADRFETPDVPVVASWLGGGEVEKGRHILNQRGIATFDSPERAVRAFANLYRHHRGIEILQQIPPRLSNRLQVDQDTAAAIIREGLASGTPLLAEDKAKALISAYGIPVNPTLTAVSPEAAVVAAEKIGFPVALKILSPDIIHKSDVGGILLDLNDAGSVRKGALDLIDRARRLFPRARIDGVSVQSMFSPIQYELIMGAKHDPGFGPVILFGMGGVLAEVLNDHAIALPPLNRLLAFRLMEGTRAARLVKGYRHYPAADQELLEAVLICLSQLVIDFPEIHSLDINPLVLPNGVPMVLDARVMLHHASTQSPLHLAISPYPAQLESRIHMDQVGELLIRPIRPEDGPLLLGLFDTLSSRTVYYRFFSTMRQLSPAMVARFTQIDYDREIALVAILETPAGEKMIGAARVISQHNQLDGEFSVLIGDPWQGRGIGAHLLSSCLDIARQRNLRKIWGLVMAENKGMLALGRKLCFKIVHAPQRGEFELGLDLAASSPTGQNGSAAH